MNKVDVNCLIGKWPFRKLYKNSFEDLVQAHKENDILCGFVSSIDSIFYNDPFEGDEELHNIIKNSGYKHVLTVNPLLPGFIDDIQRGIELFGVKGVRIFPGYHKYRLDNPNMKLLCSTLKIFNLPLFLTVRMEDERLDYLFTPQNPTTDEISEFIKNNNEVNTLLLNLKYMEILKIKQTIMNYETVFVDTSGLSNHLFVIEMLMESIDERKVVFGSQFPLYCLKSRIFPIEMANVSSLTKNNIFIENISRLFHNHLQY